MQFPVSLPYRKLTSQLRIAGAMLAIVPLCLMTAAVAPASGQTSGPSSGDWTQFLAADMQRSNPNEKVLGVNNAGNLQLKWSQTKVNVYDLSSSPIVANGVLYFGGGDDRLYALNASTGGALWTYTAGGSLVTTPAVTNGVIYFDSSDGNVYALNASTGAKLWSYNTDTSPGAANSPSANMTVANGVVYAAMGDGMSETGTLYALDASTGRLLWSDASGLNASTPAVANGVVYFANTDHYGQGSVLALNANNGDVLWNYGGNSTGFPGWGPGPLVVSNGVVYFTGGDTSGSNLYAVNASAGKTLWTYGLSAAGSTPAVADGIVYVASVRTLYALNGTSGKELWSFAAGTTEGFSEPAAANGVVYISSSISNYPPVTGNMYALNATTGAKLWSYPLKGDGLPPIVTNGTIYDIDLDSHDPSQVINHLSAFSVGADLFLRATPSATTVHQGDLLTYSIPVWNLGPTNAVHEVLNTQVPAGTTFDYVTISGTPGLGTCTTPPYGGMGQIVCNENGSMAPNATWTVRLTVKVFSFTEATTTENAATMADTLDPNTVNNMATVNVTVQ